MWGISARGARAFDIRTSSHLLNLLCDLFIATLSQFFCSAGADSFHLIRKEELRPTQLGISENRHTAKVSVAHGLTRIEHVTL